MIKTKKVNTAIHILINCNSNTNRTCKIVKNLVKPCLSPSPGKGLITSNETMQKSYTYVLYGLLLNIANKNVKNDKNINTLWLQKAYIKLICEKKI